MSKVKVLKAVGYMTEHKAPANKITSIMNPPGDD